MLEGSGKERFGVKNDQVNEEELRGQSSSPPASLNVMPRVCTLSCPSCLITALRLEMMESIESGLASGQCYIILPSRL